VTAALNTIFYNSGIYCQIFAHASTSAKIQEQLIEKVKLSGIGKLSTWSPQQFILSHPVLYLCFYYYYWLNTYNEILLQATGWFVSHGGLNGVTESLGSGVSLSPTPHRSSPETLTRLRRSETP
jgi:hypothetical protein